MPQYLLSMHQPDGPPPPPEILDPIMARLKELDDEIKAAGAWVFAAALSPPSTATVLRPYGEKPLMTDGPYVEGKEHLGGFTIIEAADLDEALMWGGRLRDVVRGLPIEVRPIAESDAGEPGATTCAAAHENEKKARASTEGAAAP